MRVLVTIFITVFLFITGCAGNKVQISDFKRMDKKVGKFTKHMEESLFKITDKGLFSVEVLLFDGKLNVGRNAFYIVIHDSKDNDVSEAELKITARMSENDIEAKPGITGSQPGLYDVNNLELTRAGHWELFIQVRKGNNEDKVVFDFPDVQ